MVALLTLVVLVLLAVAAALAVLLLWRAHEQQLTLLEEALDREYRDITRDIPIDALLGKELSPDEVIQNIASFYRYIELTNQQVVLRRRKKIRLATWEHWREGIAAHFERPAFRTAWAVVRQNSVIASGAHSFDELARLIDQEFRADPARWPTGRAASDGRD